MPKLILGPPGCGKTYTLIEIVRKALDSGTRPEQIGFLSFTRKAVQEAAQRAGEAFNLQPQQLPYFKTLHALGYHMLGMRRDDIMGPQDWIAIGDELGMPFSGTSSNAAEDGSYMPVIQSEADRYFAIMTRAHLRCVSLEQEIKDTDAEDIHYPLLQKMEALFDVYRHQLGKYTFTDMLSMFVDIGEAPRLKLLIIDEAQDLVPLQWKVVQKLVDQADEVFYAGDDDQAIHRWAGVEVEQFLQMPVDREVLSQSYRLPQRVFDLSQQVVRRIDHRLPKEYRPVDREGSVSYHMDRFELPLDSGSWTLMARTNALVQDWAEELRQDGMLFSINGQRSIPEEVCQAVSVWRKLQRGVPAYPSEIFKLYEEMRKSRKDDPLARNGKKLLEAADPEHRYGFAELRKNFGLRATGEEDALAVIKMNSMERTYIEALERRGEDIIRPPRIKLSTIHRMKGGEDENIGLYLGSTKSAALSPYTDDEHRVFYVGVTRTKENLHVIDSGRKHRYEL